MIDTALQSLNPLAHVNDNDDFERHAALEKKTEPLRRLMLASHSIEEKKMPAIKHHLALDIEGFMSQHKTIADYDGIFMRDDGTPMNGFQAIHILQSKLDNGYRVIPTGKCDNFDPIKGCQGHPVEDKQPAKAKAP